MKKFLLLVSLIVLNCLPIEPVKENLIKIHTFINRTNFQPVIYTSTNNGPLQEHGEPTRANPIKIGKDRAGNETKMILQLNRNNNLDKYTFYTEAKREKYKDEAGITRWKNKRQIFLKLPNTDDYPIQLPIDSSINTSSGSFDVKAVLFRQSPEDGEYLHESFAEPAIFLPDN